MIKYCKYNHVAILDVDDIWLPTKLQKQIPLINEYDVVGTLCQYFGTRNDKPKIEIGEINKHVFKKHNPIINSSIIIKKELANWDKYYESVEDYDLWCRLATQNKKIYNVSEILVKHRIHKQSSFNSNPTKQNNLVKQIKNNLRF